MPLPPQPVPPHFPLFLPRPVPGTLVVLALTALLRLCPLAPLAAAGGEIDFVRDVRPILEARCYECHGPEMQRSGLRLDVKLAAFRGGEFHPPTLVPGDAGASRLLHFVSGEDPELRMPPKGDPLAPEEIAVLTAWVEAGAHWPEGVDEVELADPLAHWSFQPVARPTPPAVRGDDWPRGEIDRFLLHQLEEAGLEPSPEAERLAWLRRVHFDLVGLPPTPEEVAAFLAADSESAYAEVVDGLLASPRYGERWAQHWLDVVRYADTHGFEVNTPRPHAWPYRDYVIDAFQRDLPYDRFVLEQLAGDQLGRDAATGFLVTAAALLPGQIGKDDASKRLARQDELGEIVTNVGEGLLGLTMNCARCHHHKFDPVTAQDYYSLQAFFAGVDYGDRPMPDPTAEAEATALREKLAVVERELAGFAPVAGTGAERPPVNARVNHDRFAPVAATALRFTILETNRLEPCLDELEVFDTAGANLALGSRGAKASFSGSRVSAGRHEERFLNDGLYGNGSSWMSNEVGGGWVRLDFEGAPEIERVAWGRDREGKFKDRLAIRYRIEVLAEDGEWHTVADESDRAPYDAEAAKAAEGPEEILLDSLEPDERKRAEGLLRRRDSLTKQLESYPDGGRLVFAGKFRQAEPMPWLRRGDPEQPQEEVPPAVPAFLGDLSLDPATPDPERRLALARWIADPANPLTARVMANRIWLWHFGNGLVETANDLGHAGTPPSHPALLDWLADEFVRSGWSVKHLHRLIALSATYRQSSLVNEAGQAADSGVRLLWRYPSRRVEAEAIRDSMLAVSDRLNPKAGGPGFDLFRSRGGLSGFPPVESFDEEGRRRLVYAHKIRMEREAVFGAFDCPDAGQSMPRRTRSTTPLQALNLFNSTFTIEEAEAFAERVRAEVAADKNGESGEASDDHKSGKAEVRHAWRLALGREPEPEELDDAASVVREHGLATLCRALYNSSEFLFIP